MNKIARKLSIIYSKVTSNKLLHSQTFNAISGNKVFHGGRQIHNGKSNSVLFTFLKSRGLVRLHGKDTADFLQGLITNDVQKLIHKESSIQYSFMLNVQGRVLYDLFLYNVAEKDGSLSSVFVDVPASLVEEFITLLKRYKLRKKVDISNISNEFQVWSQFSQDVEKDASFKSEINLPETVICGPDPRVPDFGRRLISRTTKESFTGGVDEAIYRESRYKWGLPEGTDDLPPGNCFPLESNGAFVNAVSFDKGCYIGQELTARTYHTGVTRKRLMPLLFDSTPPGIDKDVTIKNEKGRNAGKFRGSQGKHGLGLIRMAHVKENLFVTANDESQVSLKAHIPHWWPEFDIN